MRIGGRFEGMQGNYGLFINEPDNLWTLSQRGDVPLNATHLELYGWVPNGMTLETRLDGTVIQNGDVSAFAGKNVELQLRFYRSGIPFSGDGANIALDRIQFVPEPSTWALTGLGGTLLCACAWWRRSRVLPGGRRS